MGAFPRTVTRFILPAIPFLILMIGPALQTVERRKWCRSCDRVTIALTNLQLHLQLPRRKTLQR